MSRETATAWVIKCVGIAKVISPEQLSVGTVPTIKRGEALRKL